VKSAVRLLILANVAVFAVQSLLGNPDWIIFKFALWPLGDFHYQGVPFAVGFEPWQIITCAFLHDGLAHVVLNMYGLWAFGSIVERALGSRRFLGLYFASVLTSGLVQLLVVSASAGPPVPTVGASGGVFGVMLAFAMLFPHSRFMLIFPPIPLKAWVLVTGYAVIELASGVMGSSSGVAHFAHLGGMLGAAIVMFSIGWRKNVQPPGDLRGP
jgi:membrane associated rhomboid family serine protease